MKPGFLYSVNNSVNDWYYRLDKKGVKLNKLLRSRIIVNRMIWQFNLIYKSFCLNCFNFLSQNKPGQKDSVSSYYLLLSDCYALFYRSDIILTSFTVITIIRVIFHHCWPPVDRQQVQLNCHLVIRSNSTSGKLTRIDEELQQPRRRESLLIQSSLCAVSQPTLAD